jgi:hypothetical protein
MPKKAIFTPEVIAKLPDMINQYNSFDDLVSAIGCSPGTLRARCSDCGISLGKFAHQSSQKKLHDHLELMDFTITVPKKVGRAVKLKAYELGTTGRSLISRLVEKIVDDDLFIAVLDGDTEFLEAGEGI